MLEYFNEGKKSIAAFLSDFIARRSAGIGAVHPLGKDACERLLGFATAGKMIRGSLVGLGLRLFAPEPAPRLLEAATAVGAAMELFQSGLLVHDDIMDRDPVRRGMDSVYRQYALLAASRRVDEADHAGEALGICAGDLAFFLAFEVLAALEGSSETRRELFGFFARELEYVAAAQMGDMLSGASVKPVSEEDILRLYRYKTGRYTFSLPLGAGALIGGAGAESVRLLEEAGELLGVVFQIRDDLLGLYGSEAETGKPVGSDVREGKKTLLSIYLREAASVEERKIVDALWGNREAVAADIEWLRRLADSRGVCSRIDAKTAALSADVERRLAAIPSLDPAALTWLKQLTVYNARRSV